MSKYEVSSRLPEIEFVEAHGFYVREGFVQFFNRNGNTEVVVAAINASLVETVTLVPDAS